MGYKGILQILLILAIISTICICIMKPQMHKPVMVYNSDFEVVHDDTSIKIEENNIPVMVQNSNIETNDNSQGNVINQVPVFTDNTENTKITNNTQNINFSNMNNTPFSNQGIKTQNTGIKQNNINNVKNNISPVNTKINTQKPQFSEPKIDLNKIVANNQKMQNTPAQNAQPQPIQPKYEHKTNPAVQQQHKPEIRIESNTTQTPVKTSSATSNTPVAMTAQEEEIAWNRWRSNLNNQIMKDSKLPTMPNGIIFKYKFTVDKYGKVSNVQTWSPTSSYTPYAIQFIAPVIRSYQGHSILNFPSGSNRVTTEVTGAWKISSNERYSNPSDYNDIEKIKK